MSQVTCLHTNHKGQPHGILTLTPTETPAVQVGPPRYTTEEGADLFEAHASRRMVLRSESELFLDSAFLGGSYWIYLPVSLQGRGPQPACHHSETWVSHPKTLVLC